MVGTFRQFLPLKRCMRGLRVALLCFVATLMAIQFMAFDFSSPSILAPLFNPSSSNKHQRSDRLYSSKPIPDSLVQGEGASGIGAAGVDIALSGTLDETEAAGGQQDPLEALQHKLKQQTPDLEDQDSVDSSLAGFRVNKLPNITSHPQGSEEQLKTGQGVPNLPGNGSTEGFSDGSERPSKATADSHQSANETLSNDLRSVDKTDMGAKPIYDEMFAKISVINQEQRIFNEEKFGPVSNNSTRAVIVIQIHNRLAYLRQLITSLSKARDIGQSLMIFSHDHWDEEINKLINTVNFAKWMQIFYPYSLQTHPKSFPGQSEDDCPRDMKRKEAELKGCINAKWPDIYNHYREASFAQVKHHWWWKANRAFKELSALQEYDGLYLFLEEDHYVAEDFLAVMTLMKREMDLKYQDCDIICLGTYLKHPNLKRFHNQMPSMGARAHGRFKSGQHVVARKSIRRSDPARLPEAALQNPASSGNMRLAASYPINVPISALHRHHESSPLRQPPAFDPRGFFGGYPPPGPYPPRRSLLWSPHELLASLLKVFSKDSFFLWQGGPVFSKNQKADVTEWMSDKHNMGMAFTKATWAKITSCKEDFCNFDDYNWDWSMNHISMACLKENLKVFLIKGPRVFHIGECGVHHRQTVNCDPTAVVKRVNQIMDAAKAFLYPSQLLVSVPANSKPRKVRKGNGGWGDMRDRELCVRMTFNTTVDLGQLTADLTASASG